jgi:DNA sulfur modification protein DndD
MKLHRIAFENFRQFRDESIEFASGGTRNVTVIHGANGSGKTTLLNAFTWLFYDEVSFDSRPDRLASEGAMEAADSRERIPVSVRLEFEHEGTSYVAVRTAVYEKRSATDFDGEQVDAGLKVTFEQDGETKARDNPANALDQIIPQRLSELFFFDGEDIDELAGIDNQDRIQEAIQNIMGLTILERATRHLDTVAKRFEDEVDELGSDELSELIQEKKSVEETIGDLNRDHNDAVRAKERIETEISDIDQKLSRLDDSAALQEQREKRLAEIEELEDEIDSIDAQIKSQVDDSGVIPLAMPLIRETAEKLDELREEGKIPSELSSEFLNTLLESKQCICGRPLEYESEPYRRVASMRGDTLADGVEQGALRVVGSLNQISVSQTEFFQTVDELMTQRMDKADEISSLEERVDQISTELQTLDQTTEDGMSIGELEEVREAKLDEKDELIKDIGRIEEKIDSEQEKLDQKEAEIAEKEDERADALLAKRRQEAAEAVRDGLEDSFADLKDKVRQWSNQRVQQTFDEIASKDLRAEITDDFALKIWQDVGNRRVEVDKSTGERQIASLAFIGSLVKIARDRYESDSDAEYFTGGIYPLVMDSPFGALDKSHRRQVSSVIPTLASQVVVLATDSQWEGPVEEEMRDRIGQQYWLDFDPGEQQGQSPRTRIETEQIAATR